MCGVEISSTTNSRAASRLNLQPNRAKELAAGPRPRIRVASCWGWGGGANEEVGGEDG